MSGRIIRVTMFKIPSKESQAKMVESYKTLSANAVKVYFQPAATSYANNLTTPRTANPTSSPYTQDP